MFKIIASGLAVVFSAALSATPAFAQEATKSFCQKEHPGMVGECVRWHEEQSKKMFTGDTGSAGQFYSNDTVHYDAAEEKRKLSVRLPVRGEIRMDSGPAKEIPLPQ
jgi:uridine phosphorylase